MPMTFRDRAIRRMKKVKRAARAPFEWLGIALGRLVLASLPRRALLAVCDFIAGAFWRFDRRGLARARANLRVMFGGRLSRKRENILVRQSHLHQ